MCKPLQKYARDAVCDLCGSSEFRLLARCDRHGNALDTVICRRCGLISHAEVPTPGELDAYYRVQYRVEYNGEHTPSPHRVVREWNRGRHLLKLLAPLIEPRQQVVEIGCGIGCTLSSFQRAGFSALGIEPGNGFRRFAIERLGVPVHGCVLADLPRRPIADLVLLVHVLEHLSSPTDALAHLRALLYAGGRCYVEVPNAGTPHAAPGKMFHYAHLYNFTRDTLEMLAVKSGFQVERWFPSRGNKNLCALLACGQKSDCQLLPGSYERAVRAVHETTALGYYLRTSYLRERLRTLWGHRCDRILARRRVERILECRHGDYVTDASWLPLSARMACPKG
jgi:SAM-dependent methyltransferase